MSGRLDYPRVASVAGDLGIKQFRAQEAAYLKWLETDGRKQKEELSEKEASSKKTPEAPEPVRMSTSGESARSKPSDSTQADSSNIAEVKDTGAPLNLESPPRFRLFRAG